MPACRLNGLILLICLRFLLRYTVFVFLPILHHFSASIHDAVKRIIGHHGPKACAFSDQLADAWDKCTSSSEDNAIGVDIGSQFWRDIVENFFDCIVDKSQRFLDRFAYFCRGDRNALW